MVQEYIHGLTLISVSANQVRIKPGRCIALNSTEFIDVESDIDVLMSASGVNGLDTGSEANSQLYAVWLIGDSSRQNAPAGLISLSFSAPTMPSGYDLKRRVGACYNNGGGNIIRFTQAGNGLTRQYFYDYSISSDTSMLVIDNGAPGSFSGVLCGSRTSDHATHVLMRIESSQSTKDGRILFRTDTTPVATPMLRWQSCQTFGTNLMWIAMNSNRQFQYKVELDVTSVDMWIVGYVDRLRSY